VCDLPKRQNVLKRICLFFLFIGSLWGFEGCVVVPQYGLGKAIAGIVLAKGYMTPYPLMYSHIIAAISNTYHTKPRARYDRGVIGTGWYKYKVRQVLFLGTTHYRYRVLVNVTRLQRGYGVKVRVPVEKDSSGEWRYAFRDRKLEKKVSQDVNLWIMRHDYGVIEIPGKR